MQWNTLTSVWLTTKCGTFWKSGEFSAHRPGKVQRPGLLTLKETWYCRCWQEILLFNPPPYLPPWASVGTASHHPGCLEIWAHIRDDHPVFQRDQESADEAPSANTMSSLLQRSNFSSTPWWTCPYKTADYHFTRCLYCLQHNVYTLVRMCATRAVGTPAPQEVMSWLITELFYFVFQ